MKLKTESQSNGCEQLARLHGAVLQVKPTWPGRRGPRVGCAMIVLLGTYLGFSAVAPEPPRVEVGIAVRDISPELPIPLAGYAGRKKAADKIDQPLLVEALALRNLTGEQFVLVSLDNCEVSHAFTEPVLQQVQARYQLQRGSVAIISSHTHSAPILADTLVGMPLPQSGEQEAVLKYSRMLQTNLVGVVGAALRDYAPSSLEYGLGRATFAMNRRVYKGDTVVFGDNPDGPVDFDVPVLRIRGTNGAVRAILFGYACHGTSVRTGDDWYVVSGEYMAYARQLLEQHEPGAVAMYLTGMGADADPAPRGFLLHAKRHGLELAGAVMGVLDRPMHPVRAPFKWAYEDVELPLADPPLRAQIEKDAQSNDSAIRQRAQVYLKCIGEGQPLPRAVKLPTAALRFGDDLTFLLMGGEVLVDYSRRLKRLLADDRPWTVGYAYEVPCYIPSARVLKEGGYEVESSLTYYGLYGPFRGEIEDLLIQHLTAMVAALRN